MRYDFAAESGRRLGLIVHRDRSVELLVYAHDDPDEVAESLWLSPEDRASLVELLAMPPGTDPGGRTHHRTWRLADEG
jgi:TrkA domain protein